MRELTFKGYLLFQLKELSGCNTTSLYIFSNLASSNARLQDALTMYLVLYTKEDLKNRLIKKYSYLKTACDQLSALEENNINDAQENKGTPYPVHQDGIQSGPPQVVLRLCLPFHNVYRDVT